MQVPPGPPSKERAGKALEDLRDEVYLATKSGRRIKDELLGEPDISFRDRPFAIIIFAMAVIFGVLLYWGYVDSEMLRMIYRH